MDTPNKIESYLLGQMSETEKVEFESVLQNNQLLKEQLELEQAIVTQIQDRAFVDQQIASAKKEIQKGKTIRLTLYSVVSIAAMLVLVFFVRGFWQGQHYDQLYASNFVTYSNDYLIINGSYRGDVAIDSLQAMAITAYEAKDFSTAINLFTRVLTTTDNPEIRFYMAISQLEVNQTNQALTNLQTLYNQPNEYRYYEQTRWYLALVSLKLHQKTDAKKYLDELVKLEGVYWDKAKELLTKL